LPASDYQREYATGTSQHRCLIPASGFFEWEMEGKRKQPYFISNRDGTPFSFAGIWETWATDEGKPIESCAIHHRLQFPDVTDP